MTPGQWWNEPPATRRYAYYLCMRQCYGMPAQEALAYVRAHYDDVKDIIADVRDALAKQR